MVYIADKPILFFDGDCNLCNSLVRFIIKRNDDICFVSLQSPLAGKLLKDNLPLEHLNTVVLLENKKIYTKSNAVLRITQKLKGLWPLLNAFLIVPVFIRNKAYDVIAANRFKWFGRPKCYVYTKKVLQTRFFG